MGKNKDNWKKLEKNNVTIPLNVLYSKKENIKPAYISKHKSNHQKQVILLLMISNGEPHKAKYEGCEVKFEGQRQWHYLAVNY